MTPVRAEENVTTENGVVDGVVEFEGWSFDPTGLGFWGGVALMGIFAFFVVQIFDKGEILLSMVQFVVMIGIFALIGIVLAILFIPSLRESVFDFVNSVGNNVPVNETLSVMFLPLIVRWKKLWI